MFSRIIAEGGRQQLTMSGAQGIQRQTTSELGSLFGGDPSLLGKTIRLNGIAFTIIGVTPRSFVGTAGFAVPDFWLPLSLEPLLHTHDDFLHDREDQCCRLFARLCPGVSIPQAQSEMTLLASRLRPLHDTQSELSKPVTALVWPGSPLPIPLNQYSGLRFALLLIMAAGGMVLLIACANVASLQLGAHGFEAE